MKSWVSKLIDQFDFDWPEGKGQQRSVNVNEEVATLLYIIDTYNKHLIELDEHPVRRVRETLDEFAKALMNPQRGNTEKWLFRFRQFFSKYRLDEYTYIQKTFDEFRGIIWEFVDQLGDDFAYEHSSDREIQKTLLNLKDAVEANSIDELKHSSRHFIDAYVEYQTKKDERKARRLSSVRENLSLVRKKLVVANHNLRRDHLTSAYNRKSFDDQIKDHHRLCAVSEAPVSLIMFDIDHFKKFNDTYGHAVGDFILIECVKLLEGAFAKDSDFVARVGGEEFAIILPDNKVTDAMKKAESALNCIRNEIFVHNDLKLSFKASMGIAEYIKGETVDEWMKRADDALYEAKTTGRDKYSVSKFNLKITAA